MSVSVVIPAYNAENTIGEAIESALLQGSLIGEILVIVNGCTDRTQEIVEELTRKDERVKLLISDKGKVPARNMGFEKSSYPLIALLDADDIWSSGKIEKQVAAINEGFDLVATQILTTTKDRIPYDKQLNHPLEHSSIVSELLAGRNCIANSSVIFKKTLLNYIGTYDDCFPFCEDYHLWLKAVKFAKMRILPERLVTYRFEPNPGYNPQIAIALSNFYRALYSFTGVIG
jgi:GT2 family glycosyltransferase